MELNLGDKKVVGAEHPFLVGFVVESPFLGEYKAVGLEILDSGD